MIFKKNNPGCPCCNWPCSCYRFDDNGNDSMGSHDLTGANAEYDTGKLDKAAKFTGTQYFEHDHDNCFVPQSTGINVWFWLHKTYQSAPTADNVVEYIVAKGLFDVPGPGLANMTSPGTWAIWLNPHHSAQTLVFSVVYEDSAIDASFAAQSYENPAEWVFFYWWYEPTAGSAGTHTGRCSLIRNATTVLDEQTVAIGDVANPMRQTDSEKLYIGKDLGKERSETIKVDNLGFCKTIGTKAEMTARAAALYNSGDGLACNNSGI